MAYTGQDLIDYEAGEEYLPQRYYQQKFQRNITGPEIMGQNSGITGASVAKPYMFEPESPKGDRGGGFGRWGDLDEGSMKVFDKQVWGVAKPGGQPGWINQPVTGYMNVNTGHYQTEEGKNINHLGLEIPSVMGTVANAITGQKFGEPQLGDTAGTFTKDKGLSEEDQAIYDAAMHRSRMNKIKAMQQDGIYKTGKDIHGGGQDISTIDTATSGGDGPTPSSINIQKQAIGMPEHLTQGGGQDLGGQTTQAAADTAGGSWKDSPFYAGGRVGYRGGQLVRPGPGRPGYKGTTWDEFKQDTSRDAMVRPGDDSWRDVYYRWLDINTFGDDLDLAQGGRVGFKYGGLASIL